MKISKISALVTTIIGCSLVASVYASPNDHPLDGFSTTVNAPGEGVKEGDAIDINVEVNNLVNEGTAAVISQPNNVAIWQMGNGDDAFVNVGQGGGVDNQVIVNTDQSKNSDVYILQLGSENESKITSKGGNSNSGSWGNFTTTGQVGSRNGAVINIAETHSNQNIVAVGQGGFDNNSWVEVLQGADDNTAVIGLVGTSNETYTSFDGPGVDENSVAVGVNGDNNYVQSIVKADPARINDSPNLVKNNDVTVLVEGDLNRLFTEQKGSDSSIDIQIMSGGESNELSIVQTNNSNVSSVVIDNSNRNVLIANQAGGSTLDVNLANDSNDNSFQVNQSNGGYLLATGNGASNNVGIVVQY